MDRGQLEVLVVEDSPSQARRLGQMLEQRGCLVRYAENGAVALEALEEAAVDVVVSDVVMPEVDGFELCRRMRDDERFAELPIILLTTLSQPSCLMEGLISGASNYVMKPYTEEVLFKRIEQTLENREHERPDVTEFDLVFGGETYRMNACGARTAGFLLSSFEDAVQRYEELQQANHQLRDALSTITRLEERYHRLLEQSAEAVLVVTTQGDVLYANSRAFALFRRGSGELEGSMFPYPLDAGTRREISFDADGETVHAELHVASTTWSGEKAFLVSLWDMTENVRLREQLRDMSLTDELTGLHNRRSFLALAQQQLRMAKRTDTPLELLYLDLDGMKAINDTHGHAVGDDALCEAAALLRQTLRDSDIVARIGGDEFAALLVGAEPGGADPKGRLKRVLSARNGNTPMPYKLSFSIGAVPIDPADDRSLVHLIAEADEAMYAKKRRRHAATG